MTELRVLLVYNPQAGDGVDVERIISLTRRAGHAVEARSVTEDDWASAPGDGFDLVVAAGGDGTVQSVFQALAGTGQVATLLPVGTANNIARSLKLADRDESDLIERWMDGKVVRFDLGRATFGSAEERFVESVGAGVFAAQLDRAEALEGEGEDDKIEFGLRNLAKVTPQAVAYEWGVLADGRDLSGRFVGVEVMNIRESGPNVPVAPSAEIDDRFLDLALIGEQHRSSLSAYVDSRLAGEASEPPRFDVFHVEWVELELPVGSALHVDDELAPTGHARSMRAVIDAGANVLLPRLDGEG